MNIEEVRKIGLSLPYATERSPYGPDTLSLEIGGKQFCLMTLDGEWNFYNLKIDPEYSEELRIRYTGIRPGYHMNKKHWVSVDFDGDIPYGLHKSLIEHAYYQTAKGLPKKTRIQIGLSK